MDKETLKWLTNAIETAPNYHCLDGIRTTIEWFYELDKDWEAFCQLINLINEKTAFYI